MGFPEPWLLPARGSPKLLACLMTVTPPRPFYLQGQAPVALPEGVTRLAWEVEKVKWQNARIRAFLGCIHLLEEVLDSNYALLHCSPDRLLVIWRKVGRVSRLIRREIGPLLKAPSSIPSLEAALCSAKSGLAILEKTVLADLDRYPAFVQPGHLIQIRKILCVSIGKLHAFLQDTLSQLMAADPRSEHDSDYYLSKQFPQDIEEAEWLYTTVDRLHTFLASLGRICSDNLSSLADAMRREQTLPSDGRWEETEIFIQLLLQDLTPLLKQTLALRGIRFDEMEALDRYAFELPARCGQVLELRAMGDEIAERLTHQARSSHGADEGIIRNLIFNHAILATKLASLLVDIEKTFCDLKSFVPLWLASIEQRRALVLKKDGD